MKLEKDIQREILNYLKTLPNCECFKIAQGAYSQRGISDIICCYNGKFIALEVKRPDGYATKLQQQFLRRIKQAGGIAEVVRSVNDVRKLLKEVEENEKV